MNEKLKQCPFCGSADIRTEPGINLNYCDKCSAEANIEHWNTRPIEDALQARIAELEAEVDALKPYRDGYDPAKEFPPKGVWVWMRDCDDNIEPVQYDYKAGFYWNYGINPDDDPIWYWEPDNGDLVRWYPIGKLPEERKK